MAVSGRVWMNREEWKRSWKPWLRGTFLGFPIGALPAGGAEIPTFLSYNIEKRLSKHPKEWGKGAIEGVAGPEAANNAAFSLLSIPEPLMRAGILVFATLGVWAISQSVFDVLLAYAAGILGFFLRRSGFPIAPIILGSILGPLLEMQFRRAMSFSQGDWTVFVTRPVSASILGLALLALILPPILQKRKKLSPVH